MYPDADISVYVRFDNEWGWEVANYHTPVDASIPSYARDREFTNLMYHNQDILKCVDKLEVLLSQSDEYQPSDNPLHSDAQAVAKEFTVRHVLAQLARASAHLGDDIEFPTFGIEIG